MRADLYLSEFGYVKSRQNAKVLIEGGKVTLDGRVLTKPSEQIDETDEHTLEIIKEKYEWLEKELSACIEAGDIPVVAGHHNLLEHNKMFNFGYMLNNSSEVEELLSRYGVSLYLSGHMHTQHIAQNENITDIVGGAFPVYPHRYGIINFNKDGWTYKSKMTDVSAYAKKTESTDDSLLNYSDYGYAPHLWQYEFVPDIFYPNYYD